MKITSGNIFNDFLDAIYTRGATWSTVIAYQKDLEYFKKWYEETNETGLVAEQITSIDLREYQSYLQNVRELKPATINRRVAVLKQYFKWIQRERLISRLPNFPKVIKEQKVQPKALHRNEQNRLLREVERRGKARDIALVRLLMNCGLRASEAVTIRIMDLDVGDRHGRLVVRGKGNKYREVPVPPETRQTLREWLAEREMQLAYLNSPWLFPSRYGEHISVRYVEQVIKNLGKFIGLNVHPHILRHTAATNMIRTGADLVTVANILGHANLNTTAIYTKPDTKTMAEALAKGEI
ncbi:MAG: Tyrosine recombinase XerC [Pelotomaculum sp. PtaB.Bin104]|nr:MAG: Tyrosine recombinase XerC [Pelotomaculum sp. PtaB.Bin104]